MSVAVGGPTPLVLLKHPPCSEPFCCSLPSPSRQARDCPAHLGPSTLLELGRLVGAVETSC